MPRLSNEKINEIRQSVDIVDVIGNYLPLERRGRNYLARCPFHNDDHPSMSVSPEKQIYRCFVCSHGGNVFTFLQDYLKISFMEAVKMVAQMGNVDLGDFTFYEEKPHVNQELEPYYLMHEEANRIYKHYLTTKLALEANSYLSQRHLSKDIIDYFEIGYAPEQNILLKAFEKRPVSLETIQDMAHNIERELRLKGESEISSREIGEMVMEHLAKVDQIAYVRFASVYRQFKDIDTFMKELNKLLEGK